ncbi:hypothetical protein PR048_029853 [Dryococelus australis]|uniref:Uncharacterized protein n=1 Tax=Dryococelus australis TaxID=614101 RepID=A0ABQ9G885_9NEOP|nr:hypothetical protein PR048_029853 [Dryococelus australis]
MTAASLLNPGATTRGKIVAVAQLYSGCSRFPQGCIPCVLCCHWAHLPARRTAFSIRPGHSGFSYKWESSWKMPLVGGFSRGSPVSPSLTFRRCSVITLFHPHRLLRPRFKGRPNLSTLNSIFSRHHDSFYRRQTFHQYNNKVTAASLVGRRRATRTLRALRLETMAHLMSVTMTSLLFLRFSDELPGPATVVLPTTNDSRYNHGCVVSLLPWSQATAPTRGHYSLVSPQYLLPAASLRLRHLSRAATVVLPTTYDSRYNHFYVVSLSPWSQATAPTRGHYSLVSPQYLLPAASLRLRHLSCLATVVLPTTNDSRYNHFYVVSLSPWSQATAPTRGHYSLVSPQYLLPAASLRLRHLSRAATVVLPTTYDSRYNHFYVVSLSPWSQATAPTRGHYSLVSPQYLLPAASLRLRHLSRAATVVLPTTNDSRYNHGCVVSLSPWSQATAPTRGHYSLVSPQYLLPAASLRLRHLSCLATVVLPTTNDSRYNHFYVVSLSPWSHATAPTRGHYSLVSPQYLLPAASLRLRHLSRAATVVLPTTNDSRYNHGCVVSLSPWSQATAPTRGHYSLVSPQYLLPAASLRQLWSSAGMQGMGKRDIPEKTRRPEASSGTIPTCENPGLTQPRIEPGSSRNTTAAIEFSREVDKTCMPHSRYGVLSRSGQDVLPHSRYRVLSRSGQDVHATQPLWSSLAKWTRRACHTAAMEFSREVDKTCMPHSRYGVLSRSGQDVHATQPLWSSLAKWTRRACHTAAMEFSREVDKTCMPHSRYGVLSRSGQDVHATQPLWSSLAKWTRRACHTAAMEFSREVDKTCMPHSRYGVLSRSGQDVHATQPLWSSLAKWTRRACHTAAMEFSREVDKTCMPHSRYGVLSRSGQDVHATQPLWSSLAKWTRRACHTAAMEFSREVDKTCMPHSRYGVLSRSGQDVHATQPLWSSLAKWTRRACHTAAMEFSREVDKTCMPHSRYGVLSRSGQDVHATQPLWSSLAKWTRRACHTAAMEFSREVDKTCMPHSRYGVLSRSGQDVHATQPLWSSLAKWTRRACHTAAMEFSREVDKTCMPHSRYGVLSRSGQDVHATQPLWSSLAKWTRRACHTAAMEFSREVDKTCMPHSRYGVLSRSGQDVHATQPLWSSLAKWTRRACHTEQRESLFASRPQQEVGTHNRFYGVTQGVSGRGDRLVAHWVGLGKCVAAGLPTATSSLRYCHHVTALASFMSIGPLNIRGLWSQSLHVANSPSHVFERPRRRGLVSGEGGASCSGGVVTYALHTPGEGPVPWSFPSGAVTFDGRREKKRGGVHVQQTATPCSRRQSDVVQQQTARPCSRRQSDVQQQTASPCSRRQSDVVQQQTARPCSRRQSDVQQQTASPCSRGQSDVVQQQTARPCSRRQSGVVQQQTASPCSRRQSDVVQQQTASPCSRRQSDVVQQQTASPCSRRQSDVVQQQTASPCCRRQSDVPLRTLRCSATRIQSVAPSGALISPRHQLCAGPWHSVVTYPETMDQPAPLAAPFGGLLAASQNVNPGRPLRRIYSHLAGLHRAVPASLYMPPYSLFSLVLSGEKRRHTGQADTGGHYNLETPISCYEVGFKYRFGVAPLRSARRTKIYLNLALNRAFWRFRRMISDQLNTDGPFHTSGCNRTNSYALQADCMPVQYIERFGRLLTARSSEPMRRIEVNMERRRNERAGVNGRFPRKTRRPTASSGTIPTCKSSVTRPGIEPGSPWWKVSVLIAQPPRPPLGYLFVLIRLLHLNGERGEVAVIEHASLTKTTRVRIPTESLRDIRMWESCRNDVAGSWVFSGISLPPPLSRRHCSIYTSLHPHWLSRPEMSRAAQSSQPKLSVIMRLRKYVGRLYYDAPVFTTERMMGSSLQGMLLGRSDADSEADSENSESLTVAPVTQFLRRNSDSQRELRPANLQVTGCCRIFSLGT